MRSAPRVRKARNSLRVFRRKWLRRGARSRTPQSSAPARLPCCVSKYEIAANMNEQSANSKLCRHRALMRFCGVFCLSSCKMRRYNTRQTLNSNSANTVQFEPICCECPIPFRDCSMAPRSTLKKLSVRGDTPGVLDRHDNETASDPSALPSRRLPCDKSIRRLFVHIRSYFVLRQQQRNSEHK